MKFISQIIDLKSFKFVLKSLCLVITFYWLFKKNQTFFLFINLYRQLHKDTVKFNIRLWFPEMGYALLLSRVNFYLGTSVIWHMTLFAHFKKLLKYFTCFFIFDFFHRS